MPRMYDIGAGRRSIQFPNSNDVEIVDALTHAIIGAMSMAPPEYRTYLVEESIIKIRIMMGEYHAYNVKEGWG